MDELLLIFFCNCKIPYNKASAVGGQPEIILIIVIVIIETNGSQIPPLL